MEHWDAPLTFSHPAINCKHTVRNTDISAHCFVVLCLTRKTIRTAQRLTTMLKRQYVYELLYKAFTDQFHNIFLSSTVVRDFEYFHCKGRAH